MESDNNDIYLFVENQVTELNLINESHEARYFVQS